MKWLGIALVLGTFAAAVDARRGSSGRESRRSGSTGPDSSLSDDACNETPTIAEGRAVRQPSLRGGIRYLFACYDDYHIYGHKYAICKYGFWSNPFPLCTSNDCERPSIPQGLRTVSLRRNSVLMFFCDDGMVTDGYKEIFCQDGKWSGPPPKCIHGSLPPRQCSFSQQSTCGWLRGNSGLFTWVLHPGGYVGTSTSSAVGLHGQWTRIGQLSITTTTTTAPTPIRTSSPTPPQSSSTARASSTLTTTADSSTINETRSSISTTEHLPSAHSIYTTTVSVTAQPSSSSTQPSSSSTQPSSSPTNQSSSRISKRSAPLLIPFERAELVSPEYPANYSGVCFRLSYLANATIPFVSLRVNDFADVFLEAQNITTHYLHGNWQDAAFEVPSVVRPFRLVIIATKVGVGVKNVYLNDVECNGNVKEESPTTEPWPETDETTDPAATDDWTSEPPDTTELPSTTTKPLLSTENSVMPSASLATSVSRYPILRRRRPFLRPRWSVRRLTHYPLRRRMPFHRWRNNTMYHALTASSVKPTTSFTSNVSTSTAPQISSVPTTKPPDNTSTTTATGLLSSSSSKISRVINEVLPPIPKIQLSPTQIAPSMKITSYIPTPPPVAYSTFTTPNTTAAAPVTKLVSIPSTPRKVNPSTLAPSSSTNAASIPTTYKVAPLSPTTKVAFTTSRIVSTATPKTTTTPKEYSTSSKIITITTAHPDSPIAKITPTASYPPLTTSYSSSKRSTMPSTSFTVSTAFKRSELPWRIIPTTPFAVPTRRNSTQRVLRFRSTSTQKPPSTTPTLKSNQSMEAWPGPRFKVRTKYNITGETQTKDSPLESVPTRTHHVSGLTYWEIAMLLIGVAITVGGLVWCLRKRFSWLQSSRMKLGDAYSLQINYADDVILDTLPSLASGRNGSANRDSVEESSADGGRKRLRKKMCSTTTLGGFSRLKGPKSYSELE